MTAWWESLTTFQHILAIFGTAATAVLVVQLISSIFGLFGSMGDSDDFDVDELSSEGFSGIDLDGDGIPDIDLDGDGIPDFSFPESDFSEIDLNVDGNTDIMDSFSADSPSIGSHEHSDFHGVGASNLAFGFSDVLSFRGIVAFLAIFSWLTLALSENNINIVLSTVIGIFCGLLVMILIGYLFYRLKSATYSGTLDKRNAIGLTGYVYLRIPANESGTGKVQITVQSRYAELEAVTRWPQEIPTGETARVVSVRMDGVLVVEPVTISKDIELRL